MKHNLRITLTLLVLFLAIQLFGLFLIAKAIPVSVEDGVVTISAPNTPVGPPPQTEPLQALLMILVGIIFGTIIILFLAKTKSFRIWKIWFLLASTITMTITFGVLFGETGYTLAAALGFVLASWKIFFPKPFIHNLTEFFIYPGLAILFYHILNIPIMIVLLALISVYDVIAVLRSKHMIVMANFLSSSKLFAGLALPTKPELISESAQSTLANTVEKSSITKYSEKKVSTKESSLTAKKHSSKTHSENISNEETLKINKQKSTMAILGGGDVAFPLLFASVVLKGLVLEGVTKFAAFGFASIVSVGAVAGLALLFFTAQKGKFYPAMPAVSAGALFGWGIMLLMMI